MCLSPVTIMLTHTIRLTLIASLRCVVRGLSPLEQQFQMQPVTWLFTSFEN